MANAKKCDKCGKLYEIVEKKIGLSIYENYETEDGKTATRSFDLCEECGEAVKNFITEEEIENE